MKASYKILLWDMDGTLMDSQEGLIASLQYTLERFGLPPENENTIRSFLGPSLKHTFQTYYGFPGEKADEAVAIFRERFAPSMFTGNRVYDGIIPLLNNLKEAGYRMAIATSKLEKFAVEIADHFGLSPYFTYICGSNEDGTRSEKAQVIAWALSHFTSYAPRDILMIGDRKMDVVGAKENGIDAAAVLYGYGTAEELTEARYKIHCVDDFRQLLL